MSERVSCPECGTTVYKATIEDAVDTAETHDEKRHDGDAKARVNGIRPPQFSEETKQQVQEAIAALQDDDE